MNYSKAQSAALRHESRALCAKLELETHAAQADVHNAVRTRGTSNLRTRNEIKTHSREHTSVKSKNKSVLV